MLLKQVMSYDKYNRKNRNRDKRDFDTGIILCNNNNHKTLTLMS